MRKSSSKNANSKDKMLVIECPECQTKFSISADKLANLSSDPQFHCSKCDNLFTIRRSELELPIENKRISSSSKYDGFQIENDDENSDDDYEIENEDENEEYVEEDYEEEDTEESEEDEEYAEDEEGEEEEYEEDEEDLEEEEGEEEEYDDGEDDSDYEEEEDEEYEEDNEEILEEDQYEDAKSDDNDYYLGKSKSSKKDSYYIDDKEDNSKKAKSNSKYTDEDSFFEDVKNDESNKINRKSAFIKNGSTYKITPQNEETKIRRTSSYGGTTEFKNVMVSQNSEFDKWLNSNATDFDKNISTVSIDNGEEDEDLLSMPKKTLEQSSKPQNKSYEFKNKKVKENNYNNLPKKVRSWEAVIKLSTPFFIFLIVLVFAGFYLKSNNDLFKKLDLSLFKTGKVPPAGLFLKNVKLISKTLNNGENIKIVTGRVLNDSDRVFNDSDILLESFLFDKNDNVILSKRVKANSQLGSYKTHELNALDSGILERMQSSKVFKERRLAPGNQTRFSIVFTDSKKFKNVAKFATRIYSVN